MPKSIGTSFIFLFFFCIFIFTKNSLSAGFCFKDNKCLLKSIFEFHKSTSPTPFIFSTHIYYRLCTNTKKLPNFLGHVMLDVVKSIAAVYSTCLH